MMFILLWVSSTCAIGSENVAIFYPEAKKPYRSIYQQIVSGSQKASETELTEFILKKDFDSQQITKQLNQAGINKVIVLGRLGYKLAKLLPKNFSVVSGALPISPNGVSGISLISDPVNLFDYLTKVAPAVRRIHVAYSKKSEWLIELAKSAAQDKGLELHLRQVKTTKEAIQFYENLFNSKMTKKDAVWLPLDRISSHDKVTLPIILTKSWAQDVVVFSSKPSHAKRGVLFSTYPDNFTLGENLYAMVLALAKDPEKKKFAALSSLQLAVNLRTAAHLGLKYSTEQEKSFELTFPE